MQRLHKQCVHDVSDCNGIMLKMHCGVHFHYVIVVILVELR